MSLQQPNDTFDFSIPGPRGAFDIIIGAGSSAVFCGANGSGKTRLAVHMENELGLKAHRISGHRALALNPKVQKVNEDDALNLLRIGQISVDDRRAKRHRQGARWSNKEAVGLLNDFDAVVQALFAEQSNTALRTHRAVRAGGTVQATRTKFERLTEIWDRLLPHCKLAITGDDIQVVPTNGATKYPASELSDGERAVFYLVGQALVADDDSLLIVDEPELHIHRSILARLWDELESARQDCAFVFITHDLKFAASRAAQKYLIRSYEPRGSWDVESVPEKTGFGEELATLILGSRQRVLFAEGTDTSLDRAIYRACFPECLIVPSGSCDDVIHAVVSMRKHATLSRISCAGVVDSDGRQPDEVQRLNDHGVAVLPVSEIENIVLLPEVGRAIAKHEGYTHHALRSKLKDLRDAVFGHVMSSDKNKEQFIVRYCKRRIDRKLKMSNVSKATTTIEAKALFNDALQSIDIDRIVNEGTTALKRAIEDRDIKDLLSQYDDKGLFALAARHLKGHSVHQFREWLVRVLGNDTVPALREEIRRQLPTIPW